MLSHLLALFDNLLLICLHLLNWLVSLNFEHPMVALAMTLLLLLSYLVTLSRGQEVQLTELLKLYGVASWGHLVTALVHRQLSQQVLVYDLLF